MHAEKAPRCRKSDTTTCWQTHSKKSVPVVECQLSSENQVNLNPQNLPEQVQFNFCAGFLSKLKQRNHNKEQGPGRSLQPPSAGLTFLRKRCSWGWELGSRVTSNRGWKMLSSNCSKFSMMPCSLYTLYSLGSCIPNSTVSILF